MTKLIFLFIVLQATYARADSPVIVGTPDPSPPPVVVSPTPVVVSPPPPVVSPPPPVVSPPPPVVSPAPADVSPVPAPEATPPEVLPADIFGGGCALKNDDKSCALAVEPSVALALWAVDLKSGKFLGGTGALPQGVCYGATYQPGRWYASGANFCLSVVAGSGDTKTQVTTSLSLSILHFGAVGIASLCEQGEVAMFCHAVLLFGATVRAR